MIQRLSLALSAGIAISLALFWLMNFMISNDQAVLEKSETLHMVDFIRLKQESLFETKKRQKPKKREPDQKPATPKMSVAKAAIQADSPDIDMPNLEIPLQPSNFQGSLVGGLKMGSRIAMGAELMPLVRIPPKYPMRAAMDRVEGWVKVEFTITEIGIVKDAVVAASKPSRVFDRAALRAIVKWKFKPKLVDGRPVSQRALQLLEFRLVK
jgi:protein TonB